NLERGAREVLGLLPKSSTKNELDHPLLITHHSRLITREKGPVVFPRSAGSYRDPRPGRYPPFLGTPLCPRRRESPGCPFPALAHRESGRFGNQECNCRCRSRRGRPPHPRPGARGHSLQRRGGKCRELGDSRVRRAVARTEVK